MVAKAARIAADNVGGARFFNSDVEAADEPVVGRLDKAFSAEFDGVGLGSRWTWVRSPDGRVGNGLFRWPTQNADLFHDDNSASVLLRDTPVGNHTVETKLTIDLGVYIDKSFQQAGLIAYEHDDLFVRLDHTAVFTTRQTEFLKEKPYASDFAGGAMAAGTRPGSHGCELLTGGIRHKGSMSFALARTLRLLQDPPAITSGGRAPGGANVRS